MFAHFEQIKDPVRAGAKLQRVFPRLGGKVVKRGIPWGNLAMKPGRHRVVCKCQKKRMVDSLNREKVTSQVADV